MKMLKGSPLLRNTTLICGLMLGRGIPAQTLMTLHDFTVGSEGASPFGGMIMSSNTLYGTTYFVDTANAGVINGTVFALSRDGTGFTNLHSFSPFDETSETSTEGSGPVASLTLSGNTLYGTTVGGGTLGHGTIFAVNTDGTGFTVLHTLNGISDGDASNAGLLLSGNTLFGTAAYGGSSNAGTVFALGTNGTGFTVLHTFTGNDGGQPYGTLVLSSNTLFGTTAIGGGSNVGTVFALNLDGTDFKVLHTFTGPLFGTNSNGAEPFAGLFLSGNMLFGETFSGGSGGAGNVFALKTDGTDFKILHNFPATTSMNPTGPGGGPFTNTDGAAPYGGLMLSGNMLYGAASEGGSRGRGTLFAVNTDGTGFTVLHTFSGGVDGNVSKGSLILSGNTLFGTADDGGSGHGTVYIISFSPQPAITSSGSTVMLSWPTNYAGFDYSGYHLQSTTNLASPVWTATLPAPFVVNGQYTVTNNISGIQQFFRLSQ